MSSYITLQNVTDVTEDLVVTDDLVALINRAADRLYKKGAAPGMVIEWLVDSIPPVSQLPVNPTEYGSEQSYECVQIPTRFSSAQFFTLNGQRRYVIPVEALYDPAGYDTTAFVDRGDEGDYRLYGFPDDTNALRINDGDDEVVAFLKKAYAPVVNGTDILPFKNASAVKLAVLATVYEDENDLERSRTYWSDALQELESDSAEFRGPQDTTISYYDAASAEVTTNLT